MWSHTDTQGLDGEKTARQARNNEIGWDAGRMDFPTQLLEKKTIHHHQTFSNNGARVGEHYNLQAQLGCRRTPRQIN
jgi:hypothetical protein